MQQQTLLEAPSAVRAVQAGTCRGRHGKWQGCQGPVCDSRLHGEVGPTTRTAACPLAWTAPLQP